MRKGKGMFTELMTADDEQPKNARQPEQAKQPEPEKPELSSELDDIAVAGYRSHSFRFTTAESRWLASFCLQLSALLDRRITHNTLVRVLLRIADDKMKNRPHDNELLNKLSELKD